MQAVLYVGHGTRLKKGVEETMQFLQQTMQHVDAPIQEIAFLELVEPDIVTGVAKCVARGATSVAIVPILLLAAQHAKEDIPQEVAKAKQQFPHIPLTVGQPLGVHDALIDTVYERVVETGVALEEEAQLLLIGRGSSDPAVEKAMQQICSRMIERHNLANVRACFLYGNGPSFEQALEELAQTDARQVFIVPYLLFSGLLSVGIEKQVKASNFDDGKIILCNSLGYNDKVRGVLLERVYETLKEGASYDEAKEHEHRGDAR